MIKAILTGAMVCAASVADAEGHNKVLIDAFGCRDTEAIVTVDRLRVQDDAASYTTATALLKNFVKEERCVMLPADTLVTVLKKEGPYLHVLPQIESARKAAVWVHSIVVDHTYVKQRK